MLQALLPGDTEKENVNLILSSPLLKNFDFFCSMFSLSRHVFWKNTLDFLGSLPPKPHPTLFISLPLGLTVFPSLPSLGICAVAVRLR